MAQADIQVTLRGGEMVENWRRYDPGEEVFGQAVITPASDIRCNHVFARLAWHTEGRGDRDTGKAAEVDLFQGVLPAGQPRTFSFQFQTPREPWSYSGHYINVVWEAVVEIDVPMALDIRGAERFILFPALRP
jgi:hypothetical protein